MGLSELDLKFFADYIQKELGIIYSSRNYFQLEKRIEEIAKNLNLNTSEEVVQQAKRGISGHFRQLLLDIATNNETSFFRDPRVFSAIENHIIPDLLKTFHPMLSMRVWSAASSFGQEPYSLAITVEEMKDKGAFPCQLEMIVTDVSSEALSRAQAGVYSQIEIQRGLPTTRLVRFFEKKSDIEWKVKESLKRPMKFSRVNLLEPFSGLGDFHILLCRNVLIYQTEEKKKEIIDHLSRRIFPGGYLILGGSESLIGLSTDFKQEMAEGAVVYKKT